MVFQREREREVGNNMCICNKRSSRLFSMARNWIIGFQNTHTLALRLKCEKRIVFRGEECIRRERHARTETKSISARDGLLCVLNSILHDMLYYIKLLS